MHLALARGRGARHQRLHCTSLHRTHSNTHRRTSKHTSEAVRCPCCSVRAVSPSSAALPIAALAGVLTACLLCAPSGCLHSVARLSIPCFGVGLRTRSVATGIDKGSDTRAVRGRVGRGAEGTLICAEGGGRGAAAAVAATATAGRGVASTPSDRGCCGVACESMSGSDLLQVTVPLFSERVSALCTTAVSTLGRLNGALHLFSSSLLTQTNKSETTWRRTRRQEETEKKRATHEG